MPPAQGDCRYSSGQGEFIRNSARICRSVRNTSRTVPPAKRC